MIEPAITLVLPYYNEVGFIEQTLESLARQTRRDFRLILVNNASTDNSEAVCRALTSSWAPGSVEHYFEAVPGKIHALIGGISLVATPLFATLDADTIYPPDYVASTIALFADNPAAAMVMAIDIYGESTAAAQRLRCWSVWALSRLFPSKCHTGAYGQAFRTEAFRAAGGYDEQVWDFVLEDHEIVHRVGKFGGQIYSPRHFCSPSPRRADRSSVTWTRSESLLYILLPHRWMDRYFYRFLAERFRVRGLVNRNLREKNWQIQDAASKSA